MLWLPAFVSAAVVRSLPVSGPALLSALPVCLLCPGRRFLLALVAVGSLPALLGLLCGLIGCSSPSSLAMSGGMEQKEADSA